MKLKIKIECPNKSDSFFVVKHSITWRSEKAEVSTKLLKNIPSVLHTTFLKNAGISAAICKSICKLYQSVEASNFRDDGGVVSCDVTNDISFCDNVKKGVVAKNIQGELRCLHKKLDDDHFLVLSNVQLHCCTEGFVQNSDNDYRKRNKNMTSEYEQMEKNTKNSNASISNPTPSNVKKVNVEENAELPVDSERVNFFDVMDNFEDFMKVIDEDNKELYWQNKQYREALPVLMKDDEKTEMDPKDRGVLQLKIGLCLTQVGRVRESASYISDGLETLKRGDTSSMRCEKLGDAVRDIAKRFRDCGQVKKGAHIIKCASWFYERVNETTTAYANLMKCMVDLRRLGVHNSPTILRSMRDIFHIIFKIGDTRPPSSATMISRCLACYYFGCTLTDEEDGTKEALEKFKLAVSTFEEKQGVHARLNNLYGVCLQNLGTCLVTEGKLYEAEETYEKALASEKMATDWESETEKTRSIEMTQRSLTSLRMKLAKLNS